MHTCPMIPICIKHIRFSFREQFYATWRGRVALLLLRITFHDEQRGYHEPIFTHTKQSSHAATRS